MAGKRTHRSEARFKWVHSSRLHLVLYSMLLVATPFLLLRRFLQEAIGKCSNAGFELGGRNVPIVPTVALLVLVVLLVSCRAHLNRLRVLAGVIALLMIALGQQIADYYFDHRFYELQQNWHYLAYAIFSFMMYRDLAPRGIATARIMLITFSCAVLFSTFDEVFQFGISGRGFEMGDIGKDAWGAVAGMALVYLGENQSGAMLTRWRPARHRKLRGYVTHPFSTFMLLLVLSLLFLCFSSLLSSLSYWGPIILLTIGAFTVVFVLFHISQYAWGKYCLITVFAIGLGLQSYFFLKYRSDWIVYNQYGLTVYKGIPIFFLDAMILPDGTFRLVDKKHYFSHRDRHFFLKQRTDIILIGSGARDKGGYGFYQKIPSQFIYNPYTGRGTQVIILKTPDACQLFNRLKRAQKSVLFVLHNTC